MEQGLESIKEISPVGRLTLEKAAALKEELQKALQANQKVKLDLTRVEDVDLSFIQLIYAARREAIASGRQFELSGRISAPILQLLHIGGFSKENSSDAHELEASLHNLPRGV